MNDTRYFRSTGSLATVAAYMPRNYVVDFVGTDGKVYGYGTDDAGWTLDDYVVPRLASGLYFAEEVTGEAFGAAYAATVRDDVVDAFAHVPLLDPNPNEVQ